MGHNHYAKFNCNGHFETAGESSVVLGAKSKVLRPQRSENSSKLPTI